MWETYLVGVAGRKWNCGKAQKMVIFRKLYAGNLNFPIDKILKRL